MDALFGAKIALCIFERVVRKRAILKADDKYIVSLKNGVLTGNKTAGADKKESLQLFIALKRERILTI